MPNKNQIILMGHLGKDPEIRYTSGGIAVCEFSLATTASKKDKTKETQWHRVICWRKIAESVSRFNKGEAVFVEGALKYDEWEKDGIKRKAAKIYANVVYKIDYEKETKHSNAQEEIVETQEVADDIIPF